MKVEIRDFMNGQKVLGTIEIPVGALVPGKKLMLTIGGHRIQLPIAQVRQESGAIEFCLKSEGLNIEDLKQMEGFKPA